MSEQSVDFDQLIQIISEQLTEPRYLSTRMASQMVTGYNLDHPIDGVVEAHLGEWEETELEHFFCGLFTPKDAERLACEPHLPMQGLTAEQTAELVDRLEAAKLTCTTWFEDRSNPMPILPIFIERHIKVLRLQQAVPEDLHPMINGISSDKVQTHLRMEGRRRVWQDAKNRNAILLPWVKKVDGKVDAERVAFIGEFTRTNRPRDLEHMLDQLINMAESYRLSEEGGSFDGVSKKHGSSGIRSKKTGEQVKAHRLAMAQAVLADCGRSMSIPEPVMAMEDPFTDDPFS
uniref:Uncharacterized protein n=1 Tax=Magnetococcus massalia (strain MO-1) TaxID=451514 RepID=A0A1S7LDG7_MAGMO|nr:conserved protein of unknown function [Candidatus Magnetococcus massalia]